MSAPISTPTLHRVPALDAVRVIGSVAVVGHHVGFATGINTGGGVWGGWLSRLDAGVAVFFVLSGFLLFRPWVHAKTTGKAAPDPLTYLWRRAMRILPAYWVTVVVCLLVLPRNANVTNADWIRHLTLTQIYEAGNLKHGLSQTWSLATEVVFYLLLPVLGVYLTSGRHRSGRPWAIIGFSVLITGVWVALIAGGVLTPTPHTMWLPAYALWFGAGMLLAAVQVGLRDGRMARWGFLDGMAAAPLACWAAALAVFAIATTPVGGPHGLTEPSAGELAVKLVLYMLLAVLIVVPLAFGPETRTKLALSGGTVKWLGAVSYGLFLWHPFVIESIYWVTGRPEFTGSFGVTFALTVAGGLVLAALCYYLIESPCQRLSHRWPRTPRPTSTDSQRSTAQASAVS
ncbi:acyltransferase family protein [Actinoplanes sp. CA-252034]|uniref:acyltransferase family protein n=1 Tax=Actinoplanes sp. CA-252034 TaxID=3239906 RepID=UPI003D983976